MVQCERAHVVAARDVLLDVASWASCTSLIARPSEWRSRGALYVVTPTSSDWTRTLSVSVREGQTERRRSVHIQDPLTDLQARADARHPRPRARTPPAQTDSDISPLSPVCRSPDTPLARPFEGCPSPPEPPQATMLPNPSIPSHRATPWRLQRAGRTPVFPGKRGVPEGTDP